MPRLVHKVTYNSQRDNQTIGTITGGSQCGYACACMLISTLNPEASKDYWVADFVDSMEPMFGRKGIGEWIISLPGFEWLRRRRVGSYMPAYEKAIGRNVAARGYVAVANYNTTSATIKAALDAGSPVMIGTKITESGHFILVIGYDDEKGVWICNDPYGNAIKGYNRRYTGAGVEYAYGWLESRVNNLDGVLGRWRGIWIKQK